MEESIFYNGYRTLTYNALFNFIVGERGCGKTFWFKEWAIKDFIKTGHQFAYVRRYKPELKKSLETFFSDIAFKFPGHTFRVNGDKFIIDDKVAGYSFTLSTAKSFKSVSFPMINKIGFDEFLIEKSSGHYLNDDVGSFLNLYETIARPGTGHIDVTVFFLSNAITWTNPYFIYFDVKKPSNIDKNGKLIWKNKEVLIELTEQLAFREIKTNSRFGSLIKNTPYGDYSIENKFLLDDDTFIERKGSSAKYYFTFRYREKDYGVWADFVEGKLWVSKNIDPSYPLIYAITMKDHNPNTLLLKAFSKKGQFKIFMDAYKSGSVYYEDINIKNICYEIIKVVLNG